MLRIPSLLGTLVLATLLGACMDHPMDSPPPPDPEPPQALGMIELTLSGMGTGEISASAAPVNPFAGTAASANLSPVAGGAPAGTIQLRRVSAHTVDVGTRGAGGYRYIQAVFEARNADASGAPYSQARRNLTFVPVATTSTISGTPVRSFLKQDARPADPAIAAQLVPTGAVMTGADGRLISQYPDVLQAFTEAEVDAIGMPAGVINRFPYGFVVRHATETETRTLPANPGPEQYDGRVTFAYRIPLAANPADDPFTVVLLVVAVEDSRTRLTMSPEEAATGQAAFATRAAAGAEQDEFATRAAALGAELVTLFPGGSYSGTVPKRMLCGVRVSGTAGDPQTTLSPCPAIGSVEVTPDRPNLLVGMTQQLTARVTDVNGNPADWATVTWSSSDESVATVSSTGLVTYKRAGDATITAATAGKAAPVVVTAERLVEATLVGGHNHTCGLTRSGDAYCWGLNSRGQLGTGTTTMSDVPVAVAGGLKFKAITAGDFHTVALATTGEAYAWGDNEYGQLGGSNRTFETLPRRFASTLTFSRVEAGATHNVALTATGAAYAWGANLVGQLGDGTNVTRWEPVAVAVPDGVTFTQVSAGALHTVALTSTGAAYAWGGNADGELGNGRRDDSRTPVLVSGGLTFSRVSAGGRHTMGLTPSGKAYGWGANQSGELGDGTRLQRLTPAPVFGDVVFSQITTGYAYTMGLTAGGDIFVWGFNGNAELGDGTTIDRITPVQLPSLTFSAVQAGKFHSLALTTDGRAYAWGLSQGQIGNGPPTGKQATPAAVSGGTIFLHP